MHPGARYKQDERAKHGSDDGAGDVTFHQFRRATIGDEDRKNGDQKSHTTGSKDDDHNNTLVL